MQVQRCLLLVGALVLEEVGPYRSHRRRELNEALSLDADLDCEVHSQCAAVQGRHCKGGRSKSSQEHIFHSLDHHFELGHHTPSTVDHNQPFQLGLGASGVLHAAFAVLLECCRHHRDSGVANILESFREILTCMPSLHRLFWVDATINVVTAGNIRTFLSQS